MELIERLRRTELVSPGTGSGRISSDGTSEIKMDPPRPVLVNPDGPEAADALAKAQSDKERMREDVVRLQDEVVALWHQAPDEDRSLRECLGMSEEEYALWVHPLADGCTTTDEATGRE